MCTSKQKQVYEAHDRLKEVTPWHPVHCQCLWLYCKPHHTNFLKFLLIEACNYIPACTLAAFKHSFLHLAAVLKPSCWNQLCDSQRVYHVWGSSILPGIKLPSVMPFCTERLINQYLIVYFESSCWKRAAQTPILFHGEADIIRTHMWDSIR